MYMHKGKDEFMLRRDKYYASRQNHLTPTKKSKDHTSQHQQVEGELMHKASHGRRHQSAYLCRVEAEFNKTNNRVRDRRQSLPRKELPAGSSSPITKPASPANPSPIRPALQPLSTITQFTAMSATRNSRVYRRGH